MGQCGIGCESARQFGGAHVFEIAWKLLGLLEFAGLKAA